MTEVFKILVHNPFNWKNPISVTYWLIRVITRGFYNHEAICIKLEDNYWVIQAVRTGVTITEYNTWLTQGNRQTYYIPVNPERYNLQQVKKTALEQIGKKYDYMSLLVYLPLFIITKRWFGRTGQRSHRRLYCYELVSYILGEPDSYDVEPTI